MAWQTPHTPGPWVSRDVGEGNDPDCGAWIVELPADPQATVRRLYFGDMETNTGTDIANANAAAAAPTMLAAIDAFLGWWDDAGSPVSPTPLVAELRAAARQARNHGMTATTGE